MVKAVEAHTDAPWVVLYVKRWLAAPLQLPDGTLSSGTGEPRRDPRSSPVLANLFMHYAFDTWLAREFPGGLVRALCRRRGGALRHRAPGRAVLAALTDRMAEVGLQLHPDKTRIVYCKDKLAAARYEHDRLHLPGVYVPAARGAAARTA